MARRGELQRLLTFGDRVPFSVGLVLTLMLAMSVWGWLEPGFQTFAALAPAAILQGQLWRLVTWPFVQDDPFTLLFGGFMMYWLGQQLGFVWSDRRLLLRFLSYALFAAVATTLAALAGLPAPAGHIGVWPVANALIVSWAMLYPDRQVNVWGVLPITGKTAAWLILGGTLLYGVAAGGVRGIGLFTPHLAALALAWFLARGLGVGGPLREAKGWLAERQQRRRARHLKVVGRDGEDGDRPRWLN